jgi:hypothetical protein
MLTGKGLFKKGLDNTFDDTWNTRLANLASSYEDFLKSDHWMATKSKARSRPSVYGKCSYCNSSRNIDLHHTSYKWIGTKDELRNVIPLCREHHEEVHTFAKENKVSVRVATNILRKVYKSNQ